MFSRRILNFQFRLGQGDFGDQGVDTVDVTGLRASVDITRTGGIATAEASIRIFGMPLDVMQKLTVLQVLSFAEQRRNEVTISAGDEDSGAAVCFRGGIKEAWVDGSDSPNIAFVVSAFANLFDGMKPVPPTSYKGSVDVPLVIAGIAAQMNLTLDNHGVTARDDSPYLPGDLREQLRRICHNANITCVINDVAGTIEIWPAGMMMTDDAPLLISSTSGMVGYPSFTETGIQVKSIFNPSLTYGKTIKVESLFGPACGFWTVASVNHNLDCESPDGAWFTAVDCTLSGHVLPIGLS